MAITKVCYSFVKGTQKVTREDYPILQDRLYKLMGCSSLQEYYRKRKSYTNIPAHIKEGIESVFADFGITNTDEIWDINRKEK